MTSYHKYSIDNYTKMLQQPFNSNFHLTEDQAMRMLTSSGNYGRYRDELNATEANLKNTYIPILKSNFNGGYFLFLAICANEGRGAGNWINHFQSDTSSDPAQMMRDDINYIKGLLNSVQPVSTSAPECNFTGSDHGTHMVEDNPGRAQRDYNSMPNGSIGKYYMVATFAGNAWAYAEAWCLRNQGPVPYIYFDNPYDNIINWVKGNGQDPLNGGGSLSPSNGGNSASAKPKLKAKSDLVYCRSLINSLLNKGFYDKWLH